MKYFKNTILICFLSTAVYVLLIYSFSLIVALLYLDSANPWRQSSDVIDSLSYLLILVLLVYFLSKKNVFKVTRLSLVYAVVIGLSLRIFIIAFNSLVSNDNFFAIEFNPIFFVNAILIIPVVEEVFFRGFILDRIVKNNLSPFSAILYSSFLFSIIHFDSGYLTMLYAFVSGLALGTLFLKHGLLSAIVAHVTSNLLWYVTKLYVPILFSS